MLPKPIKFSRQRERTQLIIDALSKRKEDVLVLEEAFWKHFRHEVIDALKKDYPYSHLLPRRGRITEVMNSGVLILSREPFTVVDKAYFTYCTGADCFASKGALLVRLERDGHPVQLVMTHMQAGKAIWNKKIRNNQSRIIKSMLSRHEEQTVPQILVGDLNVDSLKGTEWPATLRTLGMTSVELSGSIRSSKAQLTSCIGKKNTTEETLVDHVAIKSHSSSYRLSRLELEQMRVQWLGQTCDLSDHLPIIATLEYE